MSKLLTSIRAQRLPPVNFQRPKAEWRRIVNGYQPAETAENVPNLPADHK
jgi:hypothetical protein